MSRIGFVRLSLMVVLTLTAHQLWASTSLTYAVGTCRPKLPSFSTISAALVATPPANTIMVCPGIYPEQVVITQPVILEATTDGDSGQVVIAVPSDGLPIIATANDGYWIAPQVLVSNTTGSVTISDITIDGAGAFTRTAYQVGVCLESASSASPSITLNHVTTRNQEPSAPDAFGVGVFINGGATDASVTVENSSIHDFTTAGIQTEAGSGALVATIKGNYVSTGPSVLQTSTTISGIFIEGASTATITNNSAVGGYAGILVYNSPGSTSGNTLTGNQYGILTGADGMPVTGNRIFNSSVAGISMFTTQATITGNSITNAAAGINFQCFVNLNVNTNTIIDVSTGLLNVQPLVTSSNTYFNVATIRSAGC